MRTGVDLPPVMTVAEVCELLRLDRRTVYSMIDDGTLESSGRSGKGRPIRIWTESVIAWARGHGVASRAVPVVELPRGKRRAS